MDKNTHQQEIIRSHRNGFGGSDAAMFYKLGNGGTLSNTDRRRVMVALGKAEPDIIETTPAMEAGHLFEDLIENEIAFSAREYKMTYDEHYPHFDIFAHADFVILDDNGTHVTECKYSQKDTSDVIKTYYCQLQWYYMLGASSVTLLHGGGGVFPFSCEWYESIPIERDDATIDVMRNGLAILEQHIQAGFFDEAPGELVEADCEPGMVAELRSMSGLLNTMKMLERNIDEAKERIKAYMEANGIVSIKGDGYSISYIQPSERRTFDTKKAQAKYADLAGDEFYKKSKVKASIRIEVK